MIASSWQSPPTEGHIDDKTCYQRVIDEQRVTFNEVVQGLRYIFKMLTCNQSFTPNTIGVAWRRAWNDKRPDGWLDCGSNWVQPPLSLWGIKCDTNYDNTRSYKEIIIPQNNCCIFGARRDCQGYSYHNMKFI